MSKKRSKNSHDIIKSRSKFWVCRCGCNGKTELSLTQHQNLIEDEKYFKIALDKVNLVLAFDEE